jgi:hypothetical protein
MIKSESVPQPKFVKHAIGQCVFGIVSMLIMLDAIVQPELERQRRYAESRATLLQQIQAIPKSRSAATTTWPGQSELLDD